MAAPGSDGILTPPSIIQRDRDHRRRYEFVIILAWPSAPPWRFGAFSLDWPRHDAGLFLCRRSETASGYVALRAASLHPPSQ